MGAGFDEAGVGGAFGLFEAAGESEVDGQASMSLQ
jgi:hypothetical protein